MAVVRRLMRFFAGSIRGSVPVGTREGRSWRWLMSGSRRLRLEARWCNRKAAYAGGERERGGKWVGGKSASFEAPRDQPDRQRGFKFHPGVWENRDSERAARRRSTRGCGSPDKADPGIPAEELPLIFDRFFRGRGARRIRQRLGAEFVSRNRGGLHGGGNYGERIATAGGLRI